MIFFAKIYELTTLTTHSHYQLNYDSKLAAKKRRELKMKTKTLLFLSLFSSLSFTALPLTAHAASPEANYTMHCASCHGKSLAGGMAGSLLDEDFITGPTHAELAKAIKSGLPDAGMPAWSKVLPDSEIYALASYIQHVRSGTNKSAKSTHHKPLKSAQNLKLKALAQADGILWGMDYTPDGRILVTQRDGILWLYDNGEFTKVLGLPEVWARGQGGLLDVAVHPDYESANNGWIYLSIAHAFDRSGAMTKIIRGKIEDGKWTNQETIFQAEKETYDNLHACCKYERDDGQ